MKLVLVRFKVSERLMCTSVLSTEAIEMKIVLALINKWLFYARELNLMIYTFKCNLTNSLNRAETEECENKGEREWVKVKTLKLKLDILWSLCYIIFSVTVV